MILKINAGKPQQALIHQITNSLISVMDLCLLTFPARHCIHVILYR